MKILIVAALSVLTSQTFAKNAIEKLMEQKNENTPYEILQNYFSKPNNIAATLDDLSFIDFNKNTNLNRYSNCIRVYDSSPTDITRTELLVAKKDKVIPAIPSSGPLFPGVPEQRIPRSTVYMHSWDLRDDSLLSSKLDSTILESMNDSLSINWEEYEDKKHVLIRKNVEDNLIVYKTEEGVYNYYGYCWNE